MPIGAPFFQSSQSGSWPGLPFSFYIISLALSLTFQRIIAQRSFTRPYRTRPVHHMDWLLFRRETAYAVGEANSYIDFVHVLTKPSANSTQTCRNRTSGIPTYGELFYFSTLRRGDECRARWIGHKDDKTKGCPAMAKNDKETCGQASSTTVVTFLRPP